jgi:hypothetical protein
MQLFAGPEYPRPLSTTLCDFWFRDRSPRFFDWRNTKSIARFKNGEPLRHSNRPIGIGQFDHAASPLNPAVVNHGTGEVLWCGWSGRRKPGAGGRLRQPRSMSRIIRSDAASEFPSKSHAAPLSSAARSPARAKVEPMSRHCRRSSRDLQQPAHRRRRDQHHVQVQGLPDQGARCTS